MFPWDRWPWQDPDPDDRPDPDPAAATDGPAVLSPADRRKVDATDDRAFYDQPRFVVHVDDGFVERLRTLYADLLSPGDRVFDAMSSWTSHLPDATFERVVGHGMNPAELAENDRLDEWFVQDFNADPALPLSDDSFDAVLCAVSVQYLQHPEPVFTEIARVVAPDGVVVVSFSNRMFPTKAVRAWREADMSGRTALVEQYVESTEEFEPPELVTDRPDRDPFYAVVARRRG